MTKGQDSSAEIYIRRKQRNLDYFKVNLPRIYQILENQVLTRAELVVTPGAKDVDMVVDGRSCYRGLAKEYSRDEALQFLKDNPPEKPAKTFPPQKPESYPQQRFASSRMRQIIETSPVTRENYQGYFRGNNLFPSVVFLGCGLGYHIEALLERTTIVSAFIVERDAEKFALSLFTIDWARICSSFQRRGYEINFAIGFESDDVDMQTLLARHLKNAVPFYPFLTTYYNHLADVELAKTATAVAGDVATVVAHWPDYDDQLIRLKNTALNIDNGIRYIQKKNLDETRYPVIVVGSGPSIDDRMDSLKQCRDKVIVLSAGTGLRALVAAGIKPDLHIELDPGYFVYQAHADMGDGALTDIPLLTIHEVNPHVPKLFGDTRYYFKADSVTPSLLGISGDGFPGCNPTCTNAALTIAYTLGFRNIFLFGTDYGFESAEKDHASESVYGDKAGSEFSRSARERAINRKHAVFHVARVNGGKILTRNDYFSAKRSVELLLSELESTAADFRVFNCADGAEIIGTTWLSQDQFRESIDSCNDADVKDLEARLASLEKQLAPEVLNRTLPDVIREAELEMAELAQIVRKASIGGVKDLALLANEIRMTIRKVAPRKGRSDVVPAQLMMNQLLQGAVLRLVHIGLSHGLACKDARLRGEFVKDWQRQVLEILKAWPDHLAQVMLDDRPSSESPWARTGILMPEPELSSGD
jgi:hypothetical protein